MEPLFPTVVITHLQLLFCRKSVYSLNELGQINGATGESGGVSEDEEMPTAHEVGEELVFTGRWELSWNWG